MSIYELEQAVKAEVIERANELKESSYPTDLLFELADSYIPIYNHELAECLADDPGLAYVDDEGLIDISKGVYSIIQTAIYERLSQAAHEDYENLPDDDDDDDDSEGINLISAVTNKSDPSGKFQGADL